MRRWWNVRARNVSEMVSGPTSLSLTLHHFVVRRIYRHLIGDAVEKSAGLVWWVSFSHAVTFAAFLQTAAFFSLTICMRRIFVNYSHTVAAFSQTIAFRCLLSNGCFSDVFLSKSRFCCVLTHCLFHCLLANIALPAFCMSNILYPIYFRGYPNRCTNVVKWCWLYKIPLSGRGKPRVALWTWFL